MTGAAVATTIGRSCGVLLQIYTLFHSSSRVQIRARHLRIDFDVLRRLTRISITGMIQYLIPTGSWTALVRIVSLSGSSALAGYTIAIRVVIFSLLPAWGLSNAAATLVGQNLGAGQPDRAASSAWRVGLYNMVFLVAIGGIFFVIPEWLIHWFSADGEVTHYAVACLRTFAVGYAFYAYGMVISQSFNGAGDTATPTWINLGCYWFLQIPLAWTLGIHFGWGAEGAFWAVPAAESVLALVLIALFRRGNWQRQRV